MKTIGEQTPALEPWLHDNRNRLLELFNDYNECKSRSFFRYPYVSLTRMEIKISP